jgi:hypothetical protein
MCQKKERSGNPRTMEALSHRQVGMSTNWCEFIEIEVFVLEVGITPSEKRGYRK